MRRTAVFAAAAGLALAGPALAQSRIAVDQIEPASRAALEAPQVGAPAPRSTPMSQVGPKDASPTTPQLARPGEADPRPQQLSARDTGAAPTTQIAKGRTAEAPAGLSSPAEGRNPRLEKVEGDDRCDPQNLVRLAPADRDRCEQVIERRAAEFEPPPPPKPSPEERLLRSQQAADGISAREAARALAHGDVEDSLAAQAIASGAHRAPDTTTARPRAERELSPETQAVVDAIVKGATGGVVVR